jgi:hypothetical protein
MTADVLPLHPPAAVTPPFVPEDNPTGCYQLSFQAPESAAGHRLFLVFDGVDSAFYCWLNGQVWRACVVGYLGVQAAHTRQKQAQVTQNLETACAVQQTAPELANVWSQPGVCCLPALLASHCGPLLEHISLPLFADVVQGSVLLPQPQFRHLQPAAFHFPTTQLSSTAWPPSPPAVCGVQPRQPAAGRVRRQSADQAGQQQRVGHPGDQHSASAATVACFCLLLLFGRRAEKPLLILSLPALSACALASTKFSTQPLSTFGKTCLNSSGNSSSLIISIYFHAIGKSHDIHRNRTAGHEVERRQLSGGSRHVVAVGHPQARFHSLPCWHFPQLASPLPTARLSQHILALGFPASPACLRLLSAAPASLCFLYTRACDGVALGALSLRHHEL